MAVKRFTAPDMRRALNMVRDELGPDAIILSSQRTAKGVEIITSTDLDLPTRGADTRREFGARFDEDLDTPLASDSAWQAQQGAAQAAKHFKVAVKSSGSKRGEQIAKEIEDARRRMMAAKKAQGQNQERVNNGAAQQFEEALHRNEQNSLESLSDHGYHSGYPEPANSEHPNFDEYNARGLAQAAQNVSEIQQPQLDLQMAGLAEQVRLKAEQEAAARGSADEARLNDLKNEIADMRLLLEQQMWRNQERVQTSFEQSSPNSLVADTLNRHLSHLGLPQDTIKPLLRCAQPGKHLSQAWREALALFTRQIPANTKDPVGKGGLFALVGPTGVGKTTTIAKLASRYVLEHGLGKVALITTDTYRVGAHDQLRALGRILSVPVKVVEKGQALSSVVASLRNFPLILIDTAGFRHGDPLLKEQEDLIAGCPGVQRLLVLSCNSQAQSLKASAHAYGTRHVAGCVLTKLDECASLGETLAVIAQQKLPVVYAASGQGIPKDIATASASALVARAVAIMKAHDQGGVTQAAAP